MWSCVIEPGNTYLHPQLRMRTAIFTWIAQENTRTYYIRIYSLGFNISEYTVRLSKHARPELELKISLGT